MAASVEACWRWWFPAVAVTCAWSLHHSAKRWMPRSRQLRLPALWCANPATNRSPSHPQPRDAAPPRPRPHPPPPHNAAPPCSPCFSQASDAGTPARHSSASARSPLSTTQTPALLPDTSQPPREHLRRRPQTPALLPDSSPDSARRPQTAPLSLGSAFKALCSQSSFATVVTCWKLFETTFPSDPDSNIDISLVEFDMQIGLLLCCNDTLIVKRSASAQMQRRKHKLASHTNPDSLLLWASCLETQTKTSCTVLSNFSATWPPQENSLKKHNNRTCPGWQHYICDISLAELKVKMLFLSHCKHTLFVQGSASLHTSLKTPWHHNNRKFPGDRIKSVAFRRKNVKMQIRFSSHFNHTLLVQRSASFWMQRLKHNLGQTFSWKPLWDNINRKLPGDRIPKVTSRGRTQNAHRFLSHCNHTQTHLVQRSATLNNHTTCLLGVHISLNLWCLSAAQHATGDRLIDELGHFDITDVNAIAL